MTEEERLDGFLAVHIDAPTRIQIWRSANRILDHHDLSSSTAQSTVLALGYVQSGKTTSITALAAAAADRGYQIVVALLGSTNLLLDQNRSRLEHALGVGERVDYFWVSETNPTTDLAGKRLQDFISKGRVCLVPVLKHAGRIASVAEQLSKLKDFGPVLIIDDEADQASMNTSQDSESRTYSAVRQLRNEVGPHLYVQYTATPYAPLLLDSADMLKPDHVEFLSPGPGYTGGKEFFLFHADTVVRYIPALDEQQSKTPPIQLQRSLTSALASFVAGATLLTLHDFGLAPISMLVHSTARNDVQNRYEFLIKRQIQRWKQELDASGTIPPEIDVERTRLGQKGASLVDLDTFTTGLSRVLREITVWLVNSSAGVSKVDWNVAPIHILIGGNKLDRGFTVEGLTVTYMNRPASTQVDTLEQRARAFGYRGDLLPYCQFFASKKTIRGLTEIVHTEEDLRARLREHIESGGGVGTWASEIGLLMPEGMLPTRTNVVRALTSEGLGWHHERIPTQDETAYESNYGLVASMGLLEAERVSQGRLEFKTLQINDLEVVRDLFESWIPSGFSPGWLQHELFEAISRKFTPSAGIKVMWVDNHGEPRIRKWDEVLGLVTLFQGRDDREETGPDIYPGDRYVFNVASEPDQIIIQIHSVLTRGEITNKKLLSMGVYLGAGSIVRKV